MKITTEGKNFLIRIKKHLVCWSNDEASPKYIRATCQSAWLQLSLLEKQK